MSTRRSLRSRSTPAVYYMGSINIHIVAGDNHVPRLAIETRRFDRSSDDVIWKFIADLKPSEYEKLSQLISDAVVTFKTPGERHSLPGTSS